MMENDKWEDVLVQWINCLKLTKPIDDITNLKTNEFFGTFFGILLSKEIKNDNVLDVVYDLLEDTYPNFKFPNRQQKRETLDRCDLLEICSLCLHYACVITTNSTLIAPLCQGLQHKTQLSVRTFLETLTTNVTPETLKLVIQESIKTEGTPGVMGISWPAMGDSPLTSRSSPLQEMFRTPLSKSKLIEKDREVKKLRLELETERYDKADLQEELREHKEKIKKIDAKLKEKCAEISKLRLELYQRESKDQQDSGEERDNREVENRLKAEILSLEKYIKESEVEQQKLHDINFKTTEKLKLSNEESRIWQEKAITLEVTHSDLVEKYTLQAVELENLKTQCDELSTIIEGLRPSHDSFNISSVPTPLKRRSFTNSCPLVAEDLAQSIVDVQLKDAQKENAELQDLLVESARRSKALDDELTDMKRSYDSVSNELLRVKSSNDDLVAQLDILATQHKSIEGLLAKSQAEVTGLLKDVQDKESMILFLRESFDETTRLNKEFQSNNNDLKLKMTTLEMELNTGKIIIEEKDNICDALRVESANLQEKYSKSVLDFENLSSNFGVLQENYDTVLRNFNDSLKKLSVIIREDSEIIFDGNFEIFDIIVDEIKKERNEDKMLIKKFTLSLSQSEDLVNTLEEKNLILSDKLNLTQMEKGKFEKLLETSEVQLATLQTEIEEKSNEINTISVKLIELNDTIYKLQSCVNKTVRQKHINNNNLKNFIDSMIEDVKQTKQNINENISNKDKDIDNLNLELNTIKTKMEELNKINETLTLDNMEQEKSYLEKMLILETDIKDLKENLRHVETNLELSEQNLRIKTTEIEELQIGKQTLEENFVRIKTDLESKLAVTNDTQRKLEMEMQIIQSEKSNLQTNVKKFTTELEELTSKRNELTEQNKDLKAQFVEYSNILRKKEKAIEDRDTIISENNKQLLNLKLELEALRQNHRTLQVEIDKIKQEECKYKFCIETLERTNTEFEVKLSELTHQKDVLKDIKDNIERKNQDLERNLKSVLEQLSTKNEELNVCCEQLSTCKREAEIESQELIAKLQEAHKKLDNLIDERNDTIQKYDEEISTVKKELQEARNKIYDLNVKEVSDLQEIQLLKSELSASFEKYAENFNVQQETKLELDNQIKLLTENLYEVVANCNRLEETNAENLEKLSKLEKELHELKSEKITLEVRLVNQQKKYEQESENTREQFLQDINNLTNKERKLEQALTKALTDLENGRGIQYRLENEVKKLSTKLQNIQQEKEYLQERFQLLENTKKEVDNEYSKLKLTHEKYISESEFNLKKLEEKFLRNVTQLTNENEKLMGDYVDLQQTLEFLKKEKELALEEHSKTVHNLKLEIEALTQKITNLELMNENIGREQELLQKNTRKMQLEIEKHVDENTKQNNIISKLQCAYDILQTGKDRVEIDLQNVQEAKQKLEEQLLKQENLLREKLKHNEEEIKTIREELETKQQLIEDKEKKLVAKTADLNELKQVYEKIHLEKVSSDEELKKSRQLHKEFLSQIDEENLKAIGDMTFDFLELKAIYEHVCHEIKNLRKDKNNLEMVIEEEKTVKNELLKMATEKEDLAKKEADNARKIEESLTEERKKMEEITKDLQNTISDLNLVKNEKFDAETQLKELHEELDNLKQERAEMCKIKEDFLAKKDEELDNNHRRAEQLLAEIKNLKSEVSVLKNNKTEIEEILQKEKESKAFLEIKLLSSLNEKTKYEQIYVNLVDNINRLSNKLIQKPIIDAINFETLNEEDVRIIKEEMESRIAEVYNQINQLNGLIENLKSEKTLIELKLLNLNTEKDDIIAVKEKLFSDYDNLTKEYSIMQTQHEKEMVLLQGELETLKLNVDNQGKTNKELENLKNENDILHQTVSSLKQNNIRAYEDYQKFLEILKTNKSSVDKLLRDRNSTETVLNDLKQKLIALQMMFIHLPQEFLYRQYFDQKESLEIIIEDLNKQFNRFSRVSFNITCNFGMLSEKMMQAILSEKSVEIEAIFKDLEIEETQEKINDIKEHTVNALEQLSSLEKTVDSLEVKSTKVLKENMRLNQNTEFKTDEDLRKKYNSLKQKLTITENVKNNYEKKLKQLRDENKKLSANKNLDSDSHYKTLLAQHVETKESLEKKINELNLQLIETQTVKVNKLPEISIDDVKKMHEKQLLEMRQTHSRLEEKIHELQEQNLAQIAQKQNDNKDTEAVREAYGKLMADNSKLSAEVENLKKLLEDKCATLNEYYQIKEAYEKLLEENNSMMTEIDTLKFKRNKDKEEYVRLLKKEREEHSLKETKTVAEIRSEYEHKLEAVRKKMINLYKSEVDKEMRKVLVEKEDNAVLLDNLKRCKAELEDAKKTIDQLHRANMEKRRNELMMSRESIGSRSVRSENDFSEVRTRDVVDCPRSHKRSSVHPMRTVVETRKCTTLPRNMDIIEEVNIKRRMSVNPADLGYQHGDINMEMEDEGELFNNKYLADLKDGHCALPLEGRESTSSRMSELAWRNSLVPPHLKSSYPAEMQMVTPSKYTEDDIKTGAVELDDSMNTKLIPADKTRSKKDAGTTSYKRPGPPTPSKNGGRQSLVGNETHPREALREQNDSSQPKRSTPNRIGAFFLGRKSFGQSNSENQPPGGSSPKNKSAVKLFRKAR